MRSRASRQTIDPQNSLTEFLDDLFNKYRDDRQPLEEKWEKNLRAFRAVYDPDDPVWKEEECEDWRSRVYLRITKNKIVSAVAIMLDMILQGGICYPFSLKASPWDLVTFEDLEKPMQQQVEKSIEQMESLINQQMLDCKADREVMLTVPSMAIYGEAYAKFFIQDVERSGYEQDPQSQVWKPYRRTIKSPAWQYVSVWDIFRDLESNDLQKCQGVFQRQMASPYDFVKQKNNPDRFTDIDAINEIIENSVTTTLADSSLKPNLRDIADRYLSIERLEYWGRAPRQCVDDYVKKTKKAAGKKWSEYLEGDEVEIHAQFANGQISRFAINEKNEKNDYSSQYSVSEPMERVFYRAVWENKLDHPEATGVADNLEDSQTILNGMVRTYIDNKKLSSNVMLALRESMVDSWDKVLKPGAKIPISEAVDDVRQAIQPVIIPDIGESIMSGINFFERASDESSMLPKIMQGEVATKKAPDTAYEMNQLLQNAGKYLGSVIRNHDEGHIEPIVNRFYQYNMLDPAIKKGKGSYICKATGFNSFQDRVIQEQRISQGIGLAVSSPIILQEVNLRYLLEEKYKRLDIDPKKALKSQEEKQQEQQQAMQMAAQQEAMVKKQMQENAQLEIQKVAAEENIKHKNQMDENQQQFIQDIEKMKVEALEEIKRLTAEYALKRDLEMSKEKKPDAKQERSKAIKPDK